MVQWNLVNMDANGLKKNDSINRVGSNFDWSILNTASLCGEPANRRSQQGTNAFI